MLSNNFFAAFCSAFFFESPEPSYSFVSFNLTDIKNLVNTKNFENPFCYKCKKHMKSKGKGQGFKCINCGKKSDKKNSKLIPRSIKLGLYIPTTSAHRHLTRPKSRLLKKNNSTKFSKNIQWVATSRT